MKDAAALTWEPKVWNFMGEKKKREKYIIDLEQGKNTKEVKILKTYTTSINYKMHEENIL